MSSPKDSQAASIIDIVKQAKNVLSQNSLDDLVIPAQGLYPHRVLWDSCFAAIGLSHYDVKKAQLQINSFLEAQWSNGMIPHIIFNPQPKYWWDRHIWRSKISPLSKHAIATSGITQPPMFAEAVVRIGERLNESQRNSWYEQIFSRLVAYHSWLYSERNPEGRGLITLIHPWEPGLDNTPPWLVSLRHHHAPWWINMITWLKFDKVADHFRFDARYVDPSERSTTYEALRLYDALRKIRRNKYDSKKIMPKSTFAIEDIVFNSIFIRANSLLKEIAAIINQELPEELLKNIALTETNFKEFWDKEDDKYYSRNQKYGNFLKEDSIGSLMPLYSGVISESRAKQLYERLINKDDFNTPYPLPSVPISSPWFKPMRYWQGPSWININWLLIDGLKRYGFIEEARILSNKSIAMVRDNGFYEYFNPQSGEPAGVVNFSWTAALIIDLVSQMHPEFID